MNSLPKVLVVDSGERSATDPLSVELGELGLASVTTSLEAADVVLDVIETPSAILIRLPSFTRGAERDAFLELASRLRASSRTVGVPVIVWDQAAAQGGISAILRSEVGPQAVSGPDL
ncbi:MAG: hypothetical protein JO048_01400 [Methylobacteriaceae bacterium]|nr:hypothetical protein [Methylobacteriaceae bacterium]